MKFTKKANKSSKKRGFSFIELSIVIAIIGALASGIIGGQKAVELAALNGARSTTQTSPVTAMDGIVLWLDTTSKKSFDKSETKNSSLITNWYDINPKLNDPINFNQTSASFKPTYTAKAIGRLPALLFNGSSFNSVNNIGIDRIASYIGEITIFVVARDDGFGYPNYVHSGFFWFWTTNPNRVGFDFTYPTMFFNYGVCCGTDGRISANITSYQSKWTIFTGVRKSNTAEIRVNGITKAGPTVSAINALPHNSQVQLIIGTGTGPGDRLAGGVAEVIVFNRGLGASEVADVEAYLSQKWKIKLQ